MWWNPDQFDETHDLCGRQAKVCSLDSLCQSVPGLGANLCFLDLQTTVLQMVSNLRTCSTKVALTHRHLTLLTWCFGYTSQERVAWPLLFRLYMVDLPIFSFSFNNFSICLGPGHIDTTTTFQVLALFSWFQNAVSWNIAAHPDTQKDYVSVRFQLIIKRTAFLCLSI